MYALLHFIDIIFNLYSFAIIIRALLPWFGISEYHPVMIFLIQITEPLLAPLRRYIPPMGGLDFTPMVGLLAVWLVEQLLQLLILALF
ncbi:MAG: YggT family protein [Chloroflexi bacterium]|nr:MAG: YggT family protein [Chloroflexota bacterium]